MEKLNKQLNKVNKSLKNYNRWAKKLGYLENVILTDNSKENITNTFVNSDGVQINTYGGSYRLMGGCVSYSKNLLCQILCDIFMEFKWKRLSKKVSHLNYIEHLIKRSKHVYGK